MENIESRLGQLEASICDKTFQDCSREERKPFAIPIIRSIKESIGEEKKDSFIPSGAQYPSGKDIIVKCSIEEMMKAFFKDYVIVWHDPNMKAQENKQYIAHLERFCKIFTFTQWNEAKDYVQSTQAVCHVITSGTNGELLVKEISTSQNVASIYIFCGDKVYHSTWAQNYNTCIETKIEEVLKKIQQNLLEWYKKTSSVKLNLPAFAPIFNDSDKSEMNHLHLYLKIIPNFTNREQAKDDFVRLSSRIYSDKRNTKLLEEFEKDYNEYNMEKTLRWYTRESFLYKVTNNCLRIATSDSIQYSRLLLKDIEQAIKDQYHRKSKDFNGLLYRGAYLSDTEWLNLKQNQGREIEMHGFLSVSKEKKIALKFMHNDPGKKVLITILVPKGPNEEEQGFAEIEEYSRFPHEKEILFNVRSRFTVLETEDDFVYSGASTCRHLVLLYGAQGFRKFITEENPVLAVSIPSMESVSCAHCNVKKEKLFFVSMWEDHYYCKSCIDYGYGVAPFLCVSSKDKVGEPTLTKIKGCFFNINSNQEQTPFYGYKCCHCQVKKQKHYFTCTDCSDKKWCEDCFEKDSKCTEIGHHNIILETSPFSFWCEKMSANEFNHLKFQNDQFQKGNKIFQQAQMYFESHKYQKAIEYYHLYFQENEARDKDTNLAASCTNIGLSYYKLGEYTKALEYHLKSVDIYKSIHADNIPDAASSYNNIGIVYTEQGEYKKALENYFKSLNIYKSVYGDNHTLVATSYNNIGETFNDQREYEKALEYYLKSLDISKSVDGDNHPHVALSYNNIGLAYDNQGEHTKALEYHLKALDIYKSVHGDNHPLVATSYNNIGQTYDNLREYKKSLESHLKALNIKKSIYGDNHPDIAYSYNNIGVAYYSQREYNKSLEYYLKALEIHKSVHADNHPLLATTYSNIGLAYGDQGKSTKALEYHLKALEIYKSVHGDNHPLVATSYNNIGQTYGNLREYKKSLEYYFKSLDIRKSVYEDNHPDIATCYNNIGVAYYSQREYKKALEYYLKAVEIHKSVHEDNHPLFATTYCNIGLAYENQREYKKALEYYLKSVDISESVYGGSHPTTIQTRNFILKLLSIHKNKL